MRHLVVERLGYLRGIPPENEVLKQQVQDVAQQTTRSVGSMQRDLSHVAQQTGTDVPPTRSGDATSAQQNRPGRSTP